LKVPKPMVSSSPYKLVFYCKFCRAFRLVYDLPSKDILTVIFDNIDLAEATLRSFRFDETACFVII